MDGDYSPGPKLASYTWQISPGGHYTELGCKPFLITSQKDRVLGCIWVMTVTSLSHAYQFAREGMLLQFVKLVIATNNVYFICWLLRATVTDRVDKLLCFHFL